MSINLHLNDENSIFSFLLSRNISEYERSYLDSINYIEKDVTRFLDKTNLDNLIDNNRNFNNDYTWINDKYKYLVKLKITLDLITNNIISFYQKK